MTALQKVPPTRLRQSVEALRFFALVAASELRYIAANDGVAIKRRTTRIDGVAISNIVVWFARTRYMRRERVESLAPFYFVTKAFPRLA